MSLAKEIVKKTKAGDSNCLSFSGSRVEELKEFQEQVKYFEEMASNGEIEIIVKNQESQTGKRFIDAVKFKRLK